MPTLILRWSPGRTDEQRAAVARGITDVLVREGNARAEDVLIFFEEILPGHWAKGGQLFGHSKSESDVPRVELHSTET
ncbi:MAG TPA: tautomerase family protein [Anaerolineae bacterium]|nr:tautomerase family protein [Anaerolineae bacterium]